MLPKYFDLMGQWGLRKGSLFGGWLRLLSKIMEPLGLQSHGLNPSLFGPWAWLSAITLCCSKAMISTFRLQTQLRQGVWKSICAFSIDQIYTNIAHFQRHVVLMCLIKDRLTHINVDLIISFKHSVERIQQVHVQGPIRKPYRNYWWRKSTDK